MEFSQTVIYVFQRKKQQDVSLNTFILQDQTVRLTELGYTTQEFRQEDTSHRIEADLVVGVPESGNAAALGYSLESGIPYGTAFVKNGYVGRTFIKPGQSSRESSVQIKLNVLKEAVKGKRVIMIDDSIVRGTTSDRIVKMLRDAGATEVHVRISSPPFLWPCYFGTDIPEREQLIAYNRSINEICEVIGADSLGYLGEERLSQMVQGLPICKGCFTGEYPMKPPTRDIRGNFER